MTFAGAMFTWQSEHSVVGCGSGVMVPPGVAV
jgi:hypothetical protein